MRRSMIICLAVALALDLRSAAPRLVRGAQPAIDTLQWPVYTQWLRINPRNPRVLFAGGVRGCDDPTYQGCHAWAMRSSDGGNTWTDLSQAIGSSANAGEVFPAPVVAADGRHLYVEASYSGGTPSSGASWVMVSANGGLTWSETDQPIIPQGGYGAGFGAIGLNPIAPGRVYGLTFGSDGDLGTVYRSDDGGTNWTQTGVPQINGGPALWTNPRLIADPGHPDTVYANWDDGPRYGTFLARSDDAGKSWTAVAAPRALHNFTITTDPRYGAVLIGRSTDPKVPTDRRYLSADGGRTWRAVSCAGDLHGACPAFVLDNAFGAGASYGIEGASIYRFHNSGPAEGRLSISDTWPVAAHALADVAAGNHAGDPVYLLANGVTHLGAADAISGTIYRSSDGGASWHALMLIAPTPASQPPSAAPGSLYVPQTHHSVGAPFVATYRRLGLYIVGHPLTEAYREGGVLTQIFDHMSLELRGGAVVVGNLGLVIYQPAPRLAPVPNTPTRLYFPRTGQILGGDMLAFWRAHGGEAIFGEPISGIVNEPNRDGSGRFYQMQWFEKACLERHPENHNPRFAILLRLLGKDLLIKRGWA